VLFAVIAGVAGWYLMPPPKYTARTLLHVEAIPPAVAFQIGENRADFFTYQRTQMALIKTRLVLTAAVHHPEVRELQCVVNQLDPVQWLEKELQVDFKIATEILIISMSGDGPEELKALVNAVKRAYLQEIVYKDTQRRQQLT